MVLTRGRGASAVRTPSLIRDYLRGEVAFPQDEPGDALARTLEGDYISRMHQRAIGDAQGAPYNVGQLYYQI